MQSSQVPNAWANQMSVKIALVPDHVFVPAGWVCSLISGFKDVAATLSSVTGDGLFKAVSLVLKRYQSSWNFFCRWLLTSEKCLECFSSQCRPVKKLETNMQVSFNCLFLKASASGFMKFSTEWAFKANG